MNKDQLIELAKEYDLMRRYRQRTHVYRRFYMFSELYKFCNYCEIARIFDMKHCSVMHGVKEHIKWMSISDQEYLKAIDELHHRIYNHKVDDLADQYLHVHAYKTIANRVELTLRFVSDDVSAFKGLNDVMTKDEFKNLL